MYNFRVKLAIKIINMALRIMPKEGRNEVFINNLSKIGLINFDKPTQ